MLKFNPAIEDNPIVDIDSPSSMQPIIFTSDRDKIIGTYFKAAGNLKKPTVLLLHGFPGNENNFDIAHAIKRFGYNVVVFHYRGSWGSGGNFSISNSLEDVSSAVEYISREDISGKLNIDSNKIILIGHSMGGFLAFLTSIKYPHLKNIAALAGFNFGFFAEYLLQNPQFVDATMEGLTSGSMLLQGTSGEKIYNEMISNKTEWNLLNHISKFSDKNILIIGAQFDHVAPLELHYNPMVKGLEKIGAKYLGEIFMSGHSFAAARIKLTTDIITWLEGLGE